METKNNLWHGTTIVSVRGKSKVVIAGDGQVSMGSVVVKSKAKKLRSLANGKVIAGFAGATADALTLFERLEEKLQKYQNLSRSCVELAKDWRTDRYLRRLEAMMIVADHQHSLVITGVGDVLEPEGGIIGIGSGGYYALAAARALKENCDDPVHVAEKAMAVAADLCVYTNNNIDIKSIDFHS